MMLCTSSTYVVLLRNSGRRKMLTVVLKNVTGKVARAPPRAGDYVCIKA